MVEFNDASETPAPKGDEALEAVRELAQLHTQTAEARTILAGLQEDVRQAEILLKKGPGGLWVEANEQLVLAMLKVQSEGDTIALALRDVLRSSQQELLSQYPEHQHELAFSEHERQYGQLREANAQLLVAALSAQELQAAAEQAHRQQTEFLALVAHELRSPLAPISTAALLVGRVRAEELPRVQALIERQVIHMTRLVGDLLDMSRVNTGKLRIERQIVDMAALIDEVAGACKPAIDKRLQQFGWYVPAGELRVLGDPIRLAQVLSNLLDNASKYTPDAGSINLTVIVVGDAMVMTVSDNGIGISPAAVPHIFDPFVQDPHAIGFNATGLGIGLTVARELIDAHGGKIVASSPGKGLGSQFVVTLPLADRPRSTDY